MSKRSKYVPSHMPLLHPDHPRPRTRREFISQGFMLGTGAALASPMALFSQRVNAALSGDINVNGCALGPQGNNKIPFICIDLAGGANIAGSNVLVGQTGGQLDLLDTRGYNKQGLPGDRIPILNSSPDPLVDNSQFINTELGLSFHSESQMLAGILARAGGAGINTNGAVIPARSQNDTGNNPHNPMYGIAAAGAQSGGLGGAMGEILALVGSRNSDSGGNSMAPASMIDLAFRPTKVDRPSDARGLVDLGGLLSLPGTVQDRVSIMEAAFRMSQDKLELSSINSGLGAGEGIGGLSDAELREAIQCAYAQSADLADRFGSGSDALDPVADSLINGPIFSDAELNGNSRDSQEFRKTAAIMKLVIEGYAGAGTITMGGYDYHTGDRRTGEERDRRAGECIGACLAYAQARNKPVMIYVVSDGSVFSNGMIDTSPLGDGKGVWTGDSQQTAAAFFLVYNPGGRPTLHSTVGADQLQHQQLGWMTGGGDVQTTSSPAANNVEALVNTVVLNYMALHDDIGGFTSKFANHGLGSNSDIDRWVAFEPIVTGTI